MKFPGSEEDFPENTLFEMKLEETRKLSPAGVEKIEQELMHHLEFIPEWPPDWRWDWMVSDNGSRWNGTLPKRVSQLYFKRYDIKLPPDLISEIGNSLSRHLTRLNTVAFDFTRNINWSKTDFGQKSPQSGTGSCLWGTNALDWISREGGAFRLWEEHPDSDSIMRDIQRGMVLDVKDMKQWNDKVYVGSGRGWVIIKPEEGVSFLFNVYGLNGRNHEMAIIMSRWLGMEWKHTGLTNRHPRGGELYINHYAVNGDQGNSFTGEGYPGFAIGTKQALEKLNKRCYDLYLGPVVPSRDHCNMCGFIFLPLHEDFSDPDGNRVCEACFRGHFFVCPHCDHVVWQDNTHESADGTTYCTHCYYDLYFICNDCGGEFDHEDSLNGADDELYCEHCWHEHFFVCNACDSTCSRDELNQVGNETICDDCFDEHYVHCTHCEVGVHEDDAYTGADDMSYCGTCFQQIFAYCADCSELFLRIELNEHEGRLLCNGCDTEVIHEEPAQVEPGQIEDPLPF